ncbi:alkyl hydroperoxide reductase E [Rubritalea halochordaticola]|uniref:Alkyl hydroperoxide reductase E n=1 Tax=Rubritalea halochordaticola TaxID=714537 RepID=A0ABP9V2R9_9BACT
MSIKIGDKAPDFTLVTKTADGPETVTLSDHIGESNILLLFVPMAFTGVCTTELCDITNSINEYADLGAKVFAISGDNPFAQEVWAQKEGIKLPLLSDYEHEVSKAYGVAYEQFLPEANLIMGGVSKRSAFVIDKAGVVQLIDIQDHPKDLPDFAAVKECLKGL